MTDSVNSVSFWKDLKNRLDELSSEDWSILRRLALLFFLILFTYPLVRSTTTAIFIQHHGAASTPTVWFFSIFVLAAAIGVYNRFQAKVSVHALFVWTCLISVCLFGLGVLALSQGFSLVAYFLYIWKEAYIILLVHMALGYLNTSIDVNLAKMLYGPFGAVGSLGGLLGGICTTILAANFFEAWAILLLSCVLIVITGLVFAGMSRKNCLSQQTRDQSKENIKRSPLESLKGVYPYIACICLVIVMTQFCINLVNFKFNLLFDQLIESEREKTQYLGLVYSTINGLSLFVQMLIVPLVMRYFGLKAIHLSIPIIYLGFVLAGLIGDVGSLFLVSMAFVAVKGLDYSLFSAAKELLYFALDAKQKFGAKYLVDMFFYRFGKGLISLLLIFYQSIYFVNTMLILSLVVWWFALLGLFYFRPRTI